MKGRTVLGVAGPSGLGAVLTCVAGTVLGGLLRPQYSHLSQAVCELTEAGTPHRRVLARFYLAYNVLLGVFATGVFLSSQRSRLFKVGWGLQLVNCVSGMLQVTAFRMDPIGSPQTGAGIAHFVFAGLSSLCSLVGAFVFGFACRRDALWRPLAPFSSASGIAILVTGVPAAVSAATRSWVMGLFERCTIGLYTPLGPRPVRVRPDPPVRGASALSPDVIAAAAPLCDVWPPRMGPHGRTRRL